MTRSRARVNTARVIPHNPRMGIARQILTRVRQEIAEGLSRLRSKPPAWIDIVLESNEADLQLVLDGLTNSGRRATIGAIASMLGITRKEYELSLLRLLVERARPFAMPSAMWSRPVTSSENIGAQIGTHFTTMGIASTPERLRACQALYARFVTDRDRSRVSLSGLAQQNFRCGHCGLAFCNEELSGRGWVSMHGLRGTPKVDLLKPHWSDPRHRVPTLDHDWPVALYGDNSARNFRILCVSCNQGKAKFMALEQTRAFTGLPDRKELLGKRPLSDALFYSQIRRQPYCVRTNTTAKESELTVQLRDSTLPAVLDNLLTVVSPGI